MVVVPDMPEHIFGCLSAAEELLIAMQNWDDVPADARTPAPVGDRAALEALHRIWDLLRPTQSDQQGRNPDPYTGPRCIAGDGTYQLTNLSSVEVPASDVDLIGAVVAELTGDNLNGNVDDELDRRVEENRRQYQNSGGREAVTRPLVSIYRLLILPADHDSQALQHALTQAGERDRPGPQRP
ncbi:MAG TPA: hypothetical protein DGG94_14210 [Micromonosporaceae bacterium]|nr:hypothetical protein [Micromonosporaceae bacterium]HCU50929.1 hypothetical protein [Micromonosporaceae bacterium]